MGTHKAEPIVDDECHRCGKKGKMNWLLLESEDKGTEVYLCDICFNAARQMWKKFLYPEDKK